MDQPIVILLYVLVALVIILPIVGRLLKRKARAAGAQRWEAKKDRNAADGGLGTTLILAADADTTRAIVDPILSATKRMRAQDDGTWAQTHYNDDDVVYEVVPVEGGSMVAVSRAIEFSGTLNGMKAWAKLRAEITTAAAARGIAVSDGVRPLVRTADTGPTGALIWRPTA